MTDQTLTISDLTVTLGQTRAVRNLSAELSGGQLVGLIGPNGAGKTSLLRAIAGLVPTDGRVSWQGNDLITAPARVRAKTIAYVPQDRHVHWPLNVAAMVALGRHPHRTGLTRWRDEDRRAVDQAIMQCDLDDFRNRPVTELSGGEMARVLLARALTVEAPILLADEPVAALDPKHQLDVMALLQNQARQSGNLGIVVLHDLTLAARYCDQLIVMDQGKLVLQGLKSQVLNDRRLQDIYGLPLFVGDHEGESFVIPQR